jgi:hypothetical protein
VEENNVEIILGFSKEERSGRLGDWRCGTFFL